MIVHITFACSKSTTSKGCQYRSNITLKKTSYFFLHSSFLSDDISYFLKRYCVLTRLIFSFFFTFLLTFVLIWKWKFDYNILNRVLNACTQTAIRFLQWHTEFWKVYPKRSFIFLLGNTEFCSCTQTAICFFTTKYRILKVVPKFCILLWKNKWSLGYNSKTNSRLGTRFYLFSYLGNKKNSWFILFKSNSISFEMYKLEYKSSLKTCNKKRAVS